VLDDELRALCEQLRVLLAKQRLEFLNAQSVETGKLNASSIHILMVKMLHTLSSIIARESN
jgi:hypothetical protein